MALYYSNKSKTNEASAIAIAAERARCELRLLATVAPLGRWGVALAERAGIAPDYFDEPDAGAIYRAIQWAHGAEGLDRATRTLGAMLMARWLLRENHLWFSDDKRTAGDGMEWGPPRLAALFAGMVADAAEQAVPALAADLLRLAARSAAA